MHCICMVRSAVTLLVLVATSTVSAQPTFVRQWSVAAPPLRVAVAPDGNVLVTLPVADRVEEFTATGVSVRTIGSPGSGPGQFNDPVGIVFNASGNLLVTDYGNGRVEEFTRSGVFVRQFGNGQLSAPGGIDVDSQGNIFVAEWGGVSEMSKFNAGGSLLIQFGAFAPQRQYMDVDLGPGDLVYVANGYGTILTYTNAGAFVTQWASVGSGPGQLSQPEGLAVAFGQVYVADTNNNRIQAFATDGTLITSWGGFGSGPGQFWAPTDVALTPDGLVYVADKFNNRIQVFQLDRQTQGRATTWGGLKSLYR